jgi:phosphotransferase system enzyme I (PtsI)
MFGQQLRAILRASAFGKVRILVPMVAHLAEAIQVRQAIERAKAQLDDAGRAYTDVELGAMIEVPAAAIAVHTFVDIVDFLSIGTNDLVQYLLAADRNNDALGELYSPLNPGVVRLLKHVINTANEYGTPVAVCGEIAGDAALTPLLLALGLTEFSLHPATLLEVRRAIRGSDLSALKARADKLLQARDRAGIESWLKSAAP